MSERRINKKILDSIVDHNEGDSNIVGFINELLLEEGEHSGQWWWKDSYKEKIDNYIKTNGESR